MSTTNMPLIRKAPLIISFSKNTWKVLQTIFWLVGLLLVTLLLFKPELGVVLFWNLLIPVAPIILVVFPGVWRNVCPLSSTALIPKKLKITNPKQLTNNQQAWLYLLGVIALLFIVPLRHLLLNTNGLATAGMLLIAAAIAIIMGVFVEWRSGWCATACPIHSVERMYGTTPLFTTDNAHCQSCEQCVSICPDSTKHMTSSLTRNTKVERLTSIIMTGGFVGFIWGWYQVPDYRYEINLSMIVNSYAWPFLGGLISIIAYILITKPLNAKHTLLVNRVFATLAVTCYYWYRIPSLFGVGLYPSDGVLIDLSGSLPHWFPILTKLLSATFFIWFMLIRPRTIQKQSWSIRPAYSIDIKNV